MPTNQWSQFAFLPERESGREYWIFGYGGVEITQLPAHVEEHPYGTLLMQFLDLDVSVVQRIRDVLHKISQVPGVEYYIHNWDDYQADIAGLGGVLPRLPAMFTEFEAVLSFYVREYLKDPISKPSFGKSDVETITKGAGIIIGHCDKIIMRHRLLMRQIDDGVFSSKGRMDALKAIQVMGEEAACALIDCSLSGHAAVVGKSGDSRVKVCFDAGVDLGGFISLSLADILGSNMKIVACQHCGKPFITSGRAIYCERGGGSASCRAVGAISKYQKSLEENQGAAAYRRAYKKYYARMIKGVATRSGFEEWRDNAKEMLELHEAGKASLNELELILEREPEGSQNLDEAKA